MAGFGTLSLATLGVLPLSAAVTGPFSFNNADKSSGIAVTNANHTATHTSGAAVQENIRGTVSKSSGSWVFAATADNVSAGVGGSGLGIANSSLLLANPHFCGEDNNSISWYDTGSVYRNGAIVGTISSFGNTDTLHVAFNSSGVWFKVNSGNWNNDPAADPATSTNPFILPANGGPFFPCYTNYNDPNAMTAITPTIIPSGYSMLI